MITTLTGENEAERSAELRRRVAEFEKEYGDMAVERLDGEEASYERMCEAAQSLPFLASRKLVVLRAPSANKEFAENLESFVDGTSETNDVIIVEPKLDKRLTYHKQLKKLTDFREYAALDANGLVNFSVKYVKEQGGVFTSSDARLLLERVGANQSTLQNELDKLMTYDTHITRKSIELLTEKTPQSSIFDLVEAAFRGNKNRTLALYAEQRAQKVEPQQIIAMLAWQLHVLAVVKTAGDRSVDEIAREAKLNPFVIRKAQNITNLISLTRLRELVTSLREFDIRSKTEGIIPDEAVQYYLIQLAV